MVEYRFSPINSNVDAVVSVLVDGSSVGIDGPKRAREMPEPALVETNDRRSDDDGEDDLSVSSIESFQMSSFSPRDVGNIKNVLEHFRTDGEIELSSSIPENLPHAAPPISPLSMDKATTTPHVPILRVTFELDEIENDNCSTSSSSQCFFSCLAGPAVDQRSSTRRQATRSPPTNNQSRPWTPAHVEPLSKNLRNCLEFRDLHAEHRLAGSHSAMECRERPVTILLPEDHPWTEEEDRVILQHFGALASNWTTILANLSRRSERCVMNRCRKFYQVRQRLLANKPQLKETLMKRRWRQDEEEADPLRRQPEGSLKRQRQAQEEAEWWRRPCEVGLTNKRQRGKAGQPCRRKALERKRLNRPEYDRIGREKEMALFQNDDWMNW
jgi:hypothetical protein